MTGIMGIRGMSPRGGGDGTDEGSRNIDKKAVVDGGMSGAGIITASVAKVKLVTEMIMWTDHVGRDNERDYVCDHGWR